MKPAIFEVDEKLINFQTLTYIRKVVEDTFQPLTVATTNNLEFVGELKLVYEELMTDMRQRFSKLEI